MWKSHIYPDSNQPYQSWTNLLLSTINHLKILHPWINNTIGYSYRNKKHRIKPNTSHANGYISKHITGSIWKSRTAFSTNNSSNHDLFHALHPITMVPADKTSERFITGLKRIMKHGDTSVLYGNIPVNNINLAYFRRTRDGFIVLSNIYHRSNQSALERFIESVR